MASFVFVVAVSFLFTHAMCAIPSFIKICYRNDPEVAKCIENSIYHLLPRLKVGIPEFEIPSIEPLEIGNVRLNTGTDAARVYANLTDIKVWHASTAKLHNLTANVARNTYKFKASVPRLRLQGKYEIDTKILFLNIKGNGPFHINVTEYRFDCILKGNPVKKDGTEHLVFEKLKCQIGFGKAGIRLENLFQVNPVLAKATNDVINDNLELFFEAIKPNLVDAITTTFTDISNKITYKFDYNEVFPIKKMNIR